MSLNRGEVALARFPHLGGGRGKKRPVVVVQADVYNQTRRHVIVAEVTTNLAFAADPTNLLIEVSTPHGQATGLKQDSLVTCLMLTAMNADRVETVNYHLVGARTIVELFGLADSTVFDGKLQKAGWPPSVSRALRYFSTHCCEKKQILSRRDFLRERNASQAPS